jgi:D-methionine transport system substrate-binding protein
MRVSAQSISFGTSSTLQKNFKKTQIPAKALDIFSEKYYNSDINTRNKEYPMKKSLMSLLVAGVLIAGLTQTVEAQRRSGNTTLTVGANPTPHGELLELVKADLAKAGIELKIVIYTDYVQPNTALISRDLDANYFQHIPYLQSNPEWPQKLSFLWGVHVEPYGFYSAKYKKLS